MLDQGDGVARGGCLHGVGLVILRGCSTSIPLRSRDVTAISKSARVTLEMQTPAVTLQIEAVTTEFIATMHDRI